VEDLTPVKGRQAEAADRLLYFVQLEFREIHVPERPVSVEKRPVPMVSFGFWILVVNSSE
jgi:hypothetical protein